MSAGRAAGSGHAVSRSNRLSALRTASVIAAALLLAIPARAGGGSSAGDAGGAAARQSWALSIVEGRLRSTFHDVSHLAPAELALLVAKNAGRVVLLDVRGADEFAVSRIAGAVHVDPDIRSASEVEKIAGDLKGKIVVAYCAIGLRSSQLIVRIGQALKEKGLAELHNLEGGAFRWRNERRPLVGPRGPTNAIHPYSLLWRQFLLDDPGE